MTAWSGQIGRIWRATLLGAAAAFVLLPLAVAQQQPCNPLIDGTYCATQMPRTRTPTQSAPMINPIQDLGRSISGDPSSPGTLGGISFRSGGTTCIGLLRRGSCS